jgi:large subunit ribosomal protein L29
MRPSEVREMTDDELLAREQELRENVFNLRLQRASGDLVNTAQVALIKRDLARVLTLIQERDLKSSDKAVTGGKGK